MFKKILFLISVVFFLNSSGVFATPSIIDSTFSDNRADYPGSQIPKYEKLEITFNLDSTYSNPYNYDTSTGGVKIDAYFISPSGDTAVISAFWFQDYLRSRGVNSTEVLNATGTFSWKARFSPTKTGTYQYYITASDNSGTNRYPASGTRNFDAINSTNPGFLRISQVNSKYFAFDNGNPFFGIGTNAGWWPALWPSSLKTYFYDDYFDTMKLNKANFVRVFMINDQWQYTDWVLTIQEGKNNIDFNYDLADAWRMDKILSSAEKNGVYIQLCLDDMNSLCYNWVGNIYNTANGGFLTYRSEFFYNQSAKKSWKQLARYLIARYGYSPSIFSWELWNEVNEIQWSMQPGESWSWDTVYQWHSEMAQEVRTLDVNKHLITTSTGSYNTFPGLYALPELDYGQIHAYYVTGGAYPSDMSNLISYYSEQLRKTVPDKPNIFGEFEAQGSDWVSEPWSDEIPPDDTSGLHLHNAIWTGFMQGLAATPLSWAWPKFLSFPAWWQNYKAMADYLEGENFIDSSLVTVTSANSNLLDNSGFENDLTGWSKNPGSSIKCNIDTANYYGGTKSLKWGSNVSEALELTHSLDLVPNQEYILTGWMKTQAVFTSYLGIGMGFYFNDGTIAPGQMWIVKMTPYYKGTTDGWMPISFAFTSPPYILGGYSYWSGFTINFSYCTGTVWIDDIKITPSGRYSPPVPNNSNIRMIAKKSNTNVLGWIQNKNNTWYNIGVLGNNLTSETASVTIPNMNDTTYLIEWWNTYNGTIFRRQKAKASDSTLTLILPDRLSTDIAVKIKPLQYTTSSGLDWTGETGYLNDGVNPESGFSNTNFTFRVKYTDSGNYFPAYVHLLLDKNGNGAYDTINMDEFDTADNNVTGPDGKIYTKTMTIPYTSASNSKNVSYKFEASDGISSVAGVPTTAINLPDINIDLSLSIPPGSVNLGEVNLASFSQPAPITVTNTSNEGSSAFTLQVLQGGNWSADSVSKKDTYVLKALFTGIGDTAIVEGDFQDDDIVTTTMDTASSARFGNSKFPENGGSVSVNNPVRLLWLLFKTPQTTSLQGDTNVSVTIGIVER